LKIIRNMLETVNIDEFELLSQLFQTSFLLLIVAYLIKLIFFK
jgi:hypothetical protein